MCVVLRERDAGAGAGAGAEVDIICAGHPLPVLVRERSAEYVGEHGPMLGAYTDEQYEPVTLHIQPGDVLVLYSDGVLDAVGPEDRFEAKRLQDALAGTASAKNAVERVHRALTDFQLGAQHDDIAIVAIERVGAHTRLDDPTHPELQPANRGA